ncbi:hypothetical protein FLL45_09655 [Aliikangiella marina]|uniref:Lipoprotein n=1 Tax=Aliikangiella marina TaxID=1712262 RepID=A0A545TD97_9GAMM|nr:hypothetical protein [Aliikangiella marina]TQV75194.1 hypothetical protein FLL45_09655 [Aliikangiella marina]
MKKLTMATGLSLSLLLGCASNPSGPNASHGLGGFFRGVAHLVLSPVQIAAGLLEGVASLPYYASTGLHKINQGMIEAQASITLDDTYEAAYGKRIKDINVDGDTNEQFRRMKHATAYLQKILKQHGVVDYDKYLLTSIDTANRQGATLFAVVYRLRTSITVIDKYNPKITRKFTTKDRLFYEPYREDFQGTPLDTIIDWAGVPIESYQSQKLQAVMLTLAANAIVNGKRRIDYWQAEAEWINGNFKTILKQQNEQTTRSMKI